MTFLDANIVLELLLPDRSHVAEVAKVLGATSTSQISLLTVHLVWHFGRIERISDGLIAKILSDYALLDVTPANYAWALANEKGNDFEDALQVSVALANGCESFVTLDKQLAKHYRQLPLKFIIPGQK